MIKNRGIFGSFTSTEVIYSLPEGEYPCEILTMLETTSAYKCTWDFKNEGINTSLKDDLPNYSNFTPQLVGFARVKAGPKEGKLIPFRLQGCGWYYRGDFTPQEIVKAGYGVENEYITQRMKVGKKEVNLRIQSPERTEICMSILNRFFNAVDLQDENEEKLKEGATVDMLLEQLEDRNLLVNIVLKERSYKKKIFTEPKFFNEFNEKVVESEDTEEENDDYGDA